MSPIGSVPSSTEGRSSPLPTLGQSIEALFASSAPTDREPASLWRKASAGAPVSVQRLTQLFDQLRGRTQVVVDSEQSLWQLFVEACAELGENIEVVRALAESERAPPFAFVTWLWRVKQALERIHGEYWTQPFPGASRDPGDAGGTSSGSPNPPAAPSSGAGVALQDGPASPGEMEVQQVSAESRLKSSRNRGRGLRSEDLLPPLVTSPSSLGVLEPLLEVAHREQHFVDRRRRLLEAARRSLLETAAAQELAPEHVEIRLANITRRIRDLNFWQLQGVAGDRDIVQQAREAVAKQDAPKLHAALSMLEEVNLQGASVSRVPHLLTHASRLASSLTVQSSIGGGASPGAEGHLGVRVHQAIAAGYARARAAHGRSKHVGLSVFEQLAAKHVSACAEFELTNAAACADGCFELGRSVAPVRAIEQQGRMRLVDFPTQTMTLQAAEGISDLPQSILGDPRLLLLDLASRRLLSRRYLHHALRPSPTNQRYREARYYLLDGSISMLGPRGRMRDSVLVSELAMLVRHHEEGSAAACPVVYYRYFTKFSEATVRVATIEQALDAIESVLARITQGDTDIEGAMATSLREIHREAVNDPLLRRAHLVVVTDGIARIDLERLRRERERLGAMPVGISIIALGKENPALKALAAEQRARGEPAFYHYLSDRTLRELLGEKPGERAKSAQQAQSKPQRTSPAPETTQDAQERAEPDPKARSDAGGQTKETADDSALAALPRESSWVELGALVEEIAALHARPDLDAIAIAAHYSAALEAVGLSLASAGLEAERARCEMLARDEKALQRRFDRWFPVGAGSPVSECPASVPPDIGAALEAALLAVTELVEYLDGSALQRRLDAIEIFEQLLLEAAIPPWTYVAVRPHLSSVSLDAIERLRAIAGARSS